MEENRTISVSKLAALERAKAMGVAIGGNKISELERQAREWRRQEEMEVQSPKSEVQSPRSEVQSPMSDVQSPTSDVRESMFQIKRLAPEDSNDRETGEGFDWKPYQSEQGEAKKKVKNLNTASVARIARKIMAREWALALGRGGGFENEQASIDRGVEEYRKKKAAEKERKEIEKTKVHRQKVAVEAALQVFGRNLLWAPKPVAPETADALLGEALSEVGECIKLTWRPDGCDLFIEPWEEKRLRQKRGDLLPALFQTTIDDNLMLSSYQKIKDPSKLQETQTHFILKNILLTFRKSAEKDFHAFEDAVAEGGRIIHTMQTDRGWKIKLEPWEEMRKRNVEQKGRFPIVTYVINTDKDLNDISCDRA